MAGVYRNLRWWLADHSAVRSFEWKEHQTLGGSPQFLAVTVLTYLTLTILLSRRIIRIRQPPPLLLRLASSFHNLCLLLLSLAMATGGSFAALSQMPSPRWLFCFPRGSTPSRGPVFFWANVFYLSKIYEFVDTLLILLGGAAARQRLSFLHVYHHVVVLVMCYVWLSSAQSLLPVGLVTNAAVHVVMYAYYFSSSVGWRWRPRWKKLVTNFQIVQFVFGFGVSLVFLWLHFSSEGGRGCSGMKGWLFTATFNASLLLLFLDFRSKNYCAVKDQTNKKQ